MVFFQGHFRYNFYTNGQFVQNVIDDLNLDHINQICFYVTGVQKVEFDYIIVKRK